MRGVRNGDSPDVEECPPSWDVSPPLRPRGVREAEIQRLTRSGHFSGMGEAVEVGEDEVELADMEEDVPEADRIYVGGDGPPDPSILDDALPEEIKAPPGAQRGERFRRFLFTCNNFRTDEDNFPLLFGACRCEPRIVYFVAGRELAPSTGTPHLQGYFEVANPMSIKQLQAWPCFANQGQFHFGCVPEGRSGYLNYAGTMLSVRQFWRERFFVSHWFEDSYWFVH